MDHLFILIEPRSEPMTVPYYGGIFDGKDWASFPTRQGWNLEHVRTRNLGGGRTVSDLDAFVQAWLYLGLLSALIGQDFHSTLTNFTSPCGEAQEGARRINTAYLLQIFPRWKDLTDQDEKKRIQRLVEEAKYHYGQLYNIDDLSIGLRLSFELLSEALSCLWGLNRSTTPQTANFLQNEYRRLGICPSVARYDNPLELSGRFMKCLLGPSKSRYCHDKCEDELCLAYSVVPELYQPRPAENCPKFSLCCRGTGQGCNFIGPDGEDIDGILMAGSFPIVRVEKTRDRLSFLVEPYQAGLKYIAISHVIADGLGNFHSNALPECRTREMFDLLAPLLEVPGLEGEGSDSRSIGFWMDTLCVPIKDQPLRKAALKIMKRCYSDAYVTLILDDELKNMKPRNRLEQAIAVITSGWASRLWTMQEVIESRESCIQFSGYVCSLSILKERLSSVLDEGFRWCRAVQGARSKLISWTALRPGRMHGITISLQYSFLSSALDWRTTSVSEDEPFCLASILNVPLERIVEGHPSDRMRDFWLSQNEKMVSVEVLFLKCPRLTEAGLRWAPSTLLIDKRRLWTQSLGKVTSDGFKCTWPGFRFRAPQEPIQRHFTLQFTSDDGFEFRLIPVKGHPHYSDMQFSSMIFLAVLYPPRMPLTDVYVANSSQYVALVNIQAENGSRIEAEYLGVFMMVADRKLLPQNPSICLAGEQVNAEWLIS